MMNRNGGGELFGVVRLSRRPGDVQMWRAFVIQSLAKVCQGSWRSNGEGGFGVASLGHSAPLLRIQLEQHYVVEAAA